MGKSRKRGLRVAGGQVMHWGRMPSVGDKMRVGGPGQGGQGEVGGTKQCASI